MFKKLSEQLKANPRTIVFTEGTDARILEAADKLTAEGVLGVILLGKADEATAKDQSVCSAFVLQGTSHFKCLIKLHSSFEAVAHIYLYQHCHILTGSFHHFVHAHFHKAHPVLQATAIFVFPMIGIGRKKLADQIAVTGMYFHCIHSGFARQMNCLSEQIGRAHV